MRNGSSLVTGERLESDLLVSGNREDGGFLLLVIERDVLVRLEEAQLADAFGGDAAGRQIRDAAAGKSQAHIGDVHFVRQNGDAGGPDLFRHRARQVEHDVQIVNHQIEHDVHVQAARAEQAQAVNFEEERQPHDLLERGRRPD